MQLGDSAKAVLRLGVFVLLVAAAASGWELLAEQTPGSILSIGMLPAPIRFWRESCATYGTLFVLGAMLSGQRRLPTACLWALRSGVALLVLTGLYAGVTGMHGVQAVDLRADAPWLFGFKYLGRVLLIAGLIAIARRALWGDQA